MRVGVLDVVYLYRREPVATILHAKLPGARRSGAGDAVLTGRSHTRNMALQIVIVVVRNGDHNNIQTLQINGSKLLGNRSRIRSL